jgi:hypothetical protein
MNNQVSLKITDGLEKQIREAIGTKSISLAQFIADAVVLAIQVEQNMDSRKQSRLLIESPRNQPNYLKLLLRQA